MHLIGEKMNPYDVERNTRLSWLNVILLSFKRNIKFDYPIPCPDKIEDRFHALNNKNAFKDVSPEIISRLEKYLSPGFDSDSELDTYMRYNDHVFGKEWFHGMGTLYRWRPGEKNHALQLINNTLTSSELEEAKKIQKIMELKLDKAKLTMLSSIITI